MFGPYRVLFEVEGSRQFCLSGFVARLPLSMMGIGTVLLVSQATGRYALAGAVAGTIALSEAVFGPLAARLMDRFGQARVLRPFLAAYLVGVAALLVVVRTGAPTWLWFVAAAFCGVLPQFGSLVRARWAAVLPPGAPRQTAFALESVIDEVVFVTGPPLITVLAIAVDPEVGLLVAAAFALAGGLWLAALRSTEPPLQHTEQRHPGLRAVLRPGVVVVALAMVGAGAVFGSMEVIVVAYSEQQGRPGLAGPILALWAAGSLVAGLAYGIVRWRRPVAQRFLVSSVVFSIAAVPLLVVNSFLSLALVIFVSGLAISPILIGGAGVVEIVMPAGTLTEGLAWTSTGLIVGVTIGAALAGPLIDAVGAADSFGLPVAAAVLSGFIALTGSRWLVGRGSAMLAR